MDKNFLKICLATQTLAVVFAGVAFTQLGDPKLAGQLTGPLFLLSGALPLIGVAFGVLKAFSPAAISSFVMTFGFSIPMLLFRYTQMSSDFGELTFFGMPAPIFHRLSSGVFLIMIACELYQLFKRKKA